ncbi:hypothetical protein [Sulfitobacter sp. JB4-11]|uniref:hypothetical protein n=1 Tax=Sulfitobacter rhodophyticola TaxID=3238304 RepID=UPI003D818D9E
MTSRNPSAADLKAIFGTDRKPDAETTHRLGSFEVTMANGQITAIHRAGQEIARGLTYLLRDKDWATCPADSDMPHAAGKIDVQGRIDASGIAFSYSLTVEPDGHDALTVRSIGVAKSDFLANRIGLTILHPVPDTVGVPLEIRHLGGGHTQCQFPRHIQPSQPAFDIAALSYPLPDGATLQITFEATNPDGTPVCFEMEDQRNWGDASYKTYIGSLLDPWPFAVKAGAVFKQSIRIAVSPASKVRSKTRTTVHKPRPFRLPELGASIPLGQGPEALLNITHHGAPPAAFVSAYLRSDRIDPDDLQAIKDVAELLSCPLRLELEIHGKPKETVPQVARKIRGCGLNVAQILACPAPYLKSYQPGGDWPDVEPLEVFYARVRDGFPTAAIGGGMLTYFTEINRKWPPTDTIDFIGHAYCPIIHASDDKTILQNAATLPLMADTIAAHARGLPYDLISASLSMRSNPYGAVPVPNPEGRRMAMAQADPREGGAFAGLWMLAIAEKLGQTHARSFCVGALAGPASIYDACAKDGRRPSFDAFAALANLAGADRQTFDAEVARLRTTTYAQAWAALRHLHV